MGPMRVLTWVATSSLLLMGMAAGCVGPEAGLNATEGSNVLRVPDTAIGDEIRQWTNISTVRFRSESVEGEGRRSIVEPYQAQQTFERWVEAANASTDAFGRPFDGIQIRERRTFLQATEGATPLRNSFKVADPASRQVVFREEQGINEVTICDGGGCRTEMRDYEYRVYPRGDERADPLSLAGTTLTLGRPISFNVTHDRFDGSRVRAFTNYTPIRVDSYGAHRAFVLKPSFGQEALSGPKISLPAPSATPTPSTSPTATPSATRPPPPPSRHEVWVTASCPFPVRVISQQPVAFEGAWLWSNVTTDTEACQAGRGGPAWRPGTPLDFLGPAPGATLDTASTFWTRGATAWKYSHTQAMQWLRSDPTFREGQQYFAAHPNAYPVTSTYVREASRRESTWSFAMSEQQGPDRVALETRLTTPTPGSPVDVAQNRVEDRPGSFRGFLLDPVDPASLRVVGLDDALRAYRTVRPGTADPGVVVQIGLEEAFFEELEPERIADAMFFTPTWRTVGNTIRVWDAEDTVTVSLFDGGLRYVNWTGDAGLYDTPWSNPPVPRVGGQAALAARTDPGPGALPPWLAPFLGDDERRLLTAWP